MRTDADETYVRKLAAYVNQRIEEVRSTSRPVQTQKLAILAALNVADELFRERREASELKGRVKDKAKRVLAYLEKEEQRQARDEK